MPTVWYFWHGFIHRIQHLCTFNIVTPLIYHLLPNVWKALYTISLSIFVDVLYWLPYSTDKFISCVVPGPLQWFFHFGKEIVIPLIPWIRIWWVWWMFQNLPLPAAQEVRPSDGDVKPGGPLGAFEKSRLWAGTGFHFLTSFHHHPTQHNNTTQTVTLTVTLTSTFSRTLYRYSSHT